MEASESKNNVNQKYYWWRFNFKKKLIKVSEERWKNHLPDFELFKINTEDLRSNFDPRNFSDCELYLEKLIRIKDELKKKELKRQKRHKSSVFQSGLGRQSNLISTSKKITTMRLFQLILTFFEELCE